MLLSIVPLIATILPEYVITVITDNDKKIPREHDRKTVHWWNYWSALHNLYEGSYTYSTNTIDIEYFVRYKKKQKLGFSNIEIKSRVLENWLS